MKIGHAALNLFVVSNLTWYADWTWALPLIVLTAIIHLFGLILINERVERVQNDLGEPGRHPVLFVVIVGTTALLATLLHGIEGAIWAAACRDFASQTLLDRTALDRETQRTKDLQGQLWQQIVAVTQQTQTAVVATYLQALNEMIDVSEKRLAAFENRVPKTVWLIIFIVAISQSFVTGFSLKRKLWFSLVMTPIVISVVMALLADLDSPRTGLIRIGQNSMERLVHDMTDAKQ
jgi:hypothetical protein